MKTASLLAVALVTLTTHSLMAQQADAGAQPGATISGGSSQVNEASNAAAATPTRTTVAARPEKMLHVRAELQGNLDSKSAKTGDRVELKTLESIKTADGAEIPKGSRILGHVTAVVAHSKGSSGDSQVSIALDRAELKGGKSFAIRSAIQWVTPPPDPSPAAFMRSQQNLGGGVMGEPTSVMGGSQSGGLGVGGNNTTVSVNGVLTVASNVNPGMKSMVDYGVQAPNQSTAQASANASGHSVVAIGAAGTFPHATGVSGVMLAADTSGKISGTFSALKRNVHLDGGTRILLALAAIN
jgi:hypothetical protein